MAKKIKQPHWWEINQYEKWESGNPKWRPPILVTTLNKELEKAGYPPLKKTQLVQAYMQILNLDSDKLEELHSKAMSKENMPFLYKLLLRNLNSNRSMDALEKMLDRAIWKAFQNWELTLNQWVNIYIPKNGRE